jgi:hypothetical protein
MGSGILDGAASRDEFRTPLPRKQNSYAFWIWSDGEHEFANQQTYSTMYEKARMLSFSRFMEGKFYSFRAMPQRVKSFGHNLDALLKINMVSSWSTLVAVGARC